MDFLTLAMERYSLRKFSDKAIEKEKLDKVLEAAKVGKLSAAENTCA